MTTWNLNRLRYTIRKITGKFDNSQLPDSSVGEVSIANPAGIDDYINDFYLYDMPEHFRSLRLRDFYTFTTVPNCGTYNVPQNVIQLYDPIYVDNYRFAFYQNPDNFYNIWPELNFIDLNLFTPDGTTQSYSFTLTQTPVQQGTVIIGLRPNQTGNTPGILETFTDQDLPIPLDIPQKQYFVNPGTLTGNQGGTGTIDYLSGAVTITYANALGPPSGTNSSVHYHPYVAARPRDIMFWQQQLFVRPIPNDTYSVKLLGEVLPTTVLSAASNSTQHPSLFVDPATTTTSAPTPSTVTIQGFSGQSGSFPTDLPQFNEWWQLIAYGAALKIFIEDGEHDEYQKYRMYFEEQKNLAQRKTLKELAQQRIQTAYSQNQGAAPQYPIYPMYANILTFIPFLSMLYEKQRGSLCEFAADVMLTKLMDYLLIGISIVNNVVN